jgi:hypothetical protein
MPDNNSLFLAQRMHKANDIASQLEHVVGCNWLWSVGLPIAALIRGHGMVSRLR